VTSIAPAERHSQSAAAAKSGFGGSAQLVVLLVALVVSLGSIGLFMNFGRGDWAAWVQAFGSIGAIAVTAWVVSRQHHLERLRAAEQQQATEIESAHIALFQLQTMQDSLEFFIASFLAPIDASPHRHFQLPAQKISHVETVEVARLGFFLTRDRSDLLREVWEVSQFAKRWSQSVNVPGDVPLAVERSQVTAPHG
jgi:hypothetical protein